MESERLAWLIRRHVIEMTHEARASHVGSCLSAADILAVLYADILRYDPRRPGWPGRDLLVLSKGHAAAALYAALAERGFFPAAELRTHCRDGGRLCGHASHRVPGVEWSTGSLGHGLGLAAGTAFALKKSGGSSQVFAVLGDGECGEGSVWETALLAPRLGLSNLTAIVDHNGLQGLDRCDSVMSLSPLEEKWRSFGWDCVTVDGHDHEELRRALSGEGQAAPRAVVARTVKGYPVTFMEGQVLWHYRFPHDGWEYDEALRQLAERIPPGTEDPYSGARGGETG